MLGGACIEGVALGIKRTVGTGGEDVVSTGGGGCGHWSAAGGYETARAANAALNEGGGGGSWSGSIFCGTGTGALVGEQRLLAGGAESVGVIPAVANFGTAGNGSTRTSGGIVHGR